MRVKFTGKPLLDINRGGSLYQERFYVRSKFRCKCFSVVHRDIQGEFLHQLHLDNGDSVKSCHTDNASLLASFYTSELLN